MTNPHQSVRNYSALSVYHGHFLCITHEIQPGELWGVFRELSIHLESSIIPPQCNKAQQKPFFSFFMFLLPARWASGFSGDHQKNHQCLWFPSYYNIIHVCFPHSWVCILLGIQLPVLLVRYRATRLSRSQFSRKSHNRHPIARTGGRNIGRLLWASSLIQVLS